MTKVLITGGAGYIGSSLCKLLLDQNYKVTVVDNFNYNQSSLNSYFVNKNFDVHKMDVRDIGSLKKILPKFDIIIPLAALVGAPLCQFKEHEAYEVNYNAIKNMLEYLSNSQFLIYPTTNSGYGIGEKNNFCTEDTPLKPLSLYGKSKVNSENLIQENFQNSTRFRLATVFGCSPRMRLDLLVNDFVFRAIKDKFIILFEAHFKRNYIHINDVCRAFLFAINNQKDCKGETFNVGLSDANLSKLELCQCIKKYANEFEIIQSEIGKDIDKRNYIVSNEKIEKLGFKTHHSLDDGIIELIKFYKFLIPDENMRNF